METYRVTGSRCVAGVEPGGTVELDLERVNVPALISGGHVELVAPPETPAPADDDTPAGKPRRRMAGGDVT